MRADPWHSGAGKHWYRRRSGCLHAAADGCKAAEVEESGVGSGLPCSRLGVAESIREAVTVTRIRSSFSQADLHLLFEGIKVEFTDGATLKGFPESFADYRVICEWDDKPLPAGVRLHKRHDM